MSGTCPGKVLEVLDCFLLFSYTFVFFLGLGGLGACRGLGVFWDDVWEFPGVFLEGTLICKNKKIY